MNFTKKIVSLLSALFICFSLSVSAYAIVAPSSDFYVTDEAGVLSEETERMIVNYNGALEAQCSGAQVVVVTVRYLDGMYCDEYAYQLFNDWGVGSAKYNNGMLLLLATEENKAWLAYGLGLNGCIDEDTVDDMLEEHFWGKFDRGRYDEAVTELFMELLEWYDDEYSAETAYSGSGSQYYYGSDYGYNDYSYYTDYQTGGSGSILSGIIRLIVVIAIFNAIFGGGSRRGGGSWLPWFLFFSSVNRNNRTGYRGYNNYRSGRSGYGGYSSGWTGGHSGFSGSSGFGGSGRSGGFGGGSGHGGGGFSGGGGGRR